MTLPLGYRYAATYAGIRKTQQDDLALIVSDTMAAAAAVFTSNRVQAAPVRLARKNLISTGGKLKAILVNAGNANCATRTGEAVALASCKAAAKALRSKAEFILPASTGVIGVELDPKPLTEALPRLAISLAPEKFEAVAHAILTTDLRKKVAYAEVPCGKGVVRIAGMTKGSGMIQPNMATTLGFVMTDAALPAALLRTMLVSGTQDSYNSLTVDGDMSTNDTLVLMANGASGVTPSSKERPAMQDAIRRVLESLAMQIAADGEGAKKLILVHVEGFKTTEDARKVARAIANSPLVKTAIAGSDPNWGRILSAAGYAGVAFEPENLDIFLQSEAVCRAGVAAEYDEADLKRRLDEPQVRIRVVHKGKGQGAARFFGCDLTEGYVQINGSYRT